MKGDFILLDRSSSMGPLWGEALSSVNAYVQTLVDEGAESAITLATFDLNGGGIAFDIIRDRVSPSDWKPVTNADAIPRGATPLNDAVGRIVALANAGAYDKAAIVIMTDGYENASTELSVAQAKELLDGCRTKGWQVVFLGANFDNAEQASSYGTLQDQTAAADPGKMVAMASMTATLSANYARTGETMSFKEGDKKAWRQ